MKRFLVCTVALVAVLSLGLVLIHCGGGGDDKQCETNEDCPQGYWCDRTVWECKQIDCIPNCTGKCCGSDGCEGTCQDNCPAGYECNVGTCQCESTSCTTNQDCGVDECCVQGACLAKSCGTLECGPDPVCGFECGPCGAGTHCDQGSCVIDVACTSDAQCDTDECCLGTPGTCTPMNCTGLECGPDPVCGKECGPCGAGQTCVGGQCQTQGSGALGDPCTFGDVNAAAGACNAGLECLGIMADGNAGTCPGGSATECTNLLEEWNRDCVTGNCGASFCSEPCDAQGNCPQGFAGQDVGDPPTCMCVPTAQGAGGAGDPCPWNGVNASYDDCQAGMACLGNDDIGSCPGGTDAECTGVAPSWNANCVSGVCGFSFCSPECGAGDTCDTGFTPADVSGTCYCIPEEDGTSQLGDPCPFGDMNQSYDFCASGLSCLGNDDAGTCPGGSATECGIPDIQNPDCVNGICGFSHCSSRCDAGGNCPSGYIPADVSGTCYCVPGETGNAQAGDPCPFGDVNSTADHCAVDLVCLGIAADGAAGTCPGGSPTECTDMAANSNPDCVNGNCGASFCAGECDASGNCAAGFAPQDVGGTCYCVPA